jgi:hypothetical protein
MRMLLTGLAAGFVGMGILLPDTCLHVNIARFLVFGKIRSDLSTPELPDGE